MKQGWEIKKLGDIAYIGLGFTHTPEYVEKGVAFLSVKDISSGKICWENIKYVSQQEYDSAPRGAKPSKGDIMFCRVGTMGKPVIIDTDLPFCTFVSLGYLHLLEKDIINTYVKYWMQSNSFEIQVEANVKGIAIKNLNTGWLKTFDIPVPSREEQERIVEELDCLSGIIERKREQLRELDALAQSIFYQMFGSVDGNHNNFEVKSLSEVFSIIKDGTHQTPQYTDDKENGIKFLSAKDVVSGTINWDNIKYIPKGLHLELHKRVAPQRNDILLCKNGTYGICALNETDEVFDIYVSLALLRPNNICIPKYLVSAINNKCTKLQFDKSIKGIGVPNLHLSEIKRTNIIVPPLTLQQEFADKIEAIEKQKELIKKSISETETLFNARMDYYFN